MAARGDPEQDFLAVEHRRAHGDIGQMRAAVIGRVDGVDVARPDLALVFTNDGLDGAVHRAEMHRHVRRVGDQRAVAVEHRAGEIEPLLDVHRIGGVLQRHAHLLGDRHEQIVEHFEHHRVGVGADGARPLKLLHPPQHQMVLRREFGLPAVLDDDGLMRLDDDGWTLDLASGNKLVTRIDQGTVPFAAGEEARAPRRRGQLGALGLARRFFERRAAADRLDRDCLDDEGFFAVDEAELRFVGLFKGRFHLPKRSERFSRKPASTTSGVSVPA